MFRHQLIKVGSLVRWHEFTGIVTRVDPDERGDKEEVEVAWLDGRWLLLYGRIVISQTRE